MLSIILPLLLTVPSAGAGFAAKPVTQYPKTVAPQQSSLQCEDERVPGDCNVADCHRMGLGKACEARYVRFERGKGDEFAQKSCKCVADPICSFFKPGQFGCAQYVDLPPSAQRVVRKWTMTEAEKQSLSQKDKLKWHNSSAYTEFRRHNQLLNGATRFCCRVHNAKKYDASGWLRYEAMPQRGGAAMISPAHCILGIIAIALSWRRD